MQPTSTAYTITRSRSLCIRFSLFNAGTPFSSAEPDPDHADTPSAAVDFQRHTASIAISSFSRVSTHSAPPSFRASSISTFSFPRFDAGGTLRTPDASGLLFEPFNCHLDGAWTTSTSSAIRGRPLASQVDRPEHDQLAIVDTHLNGRARPIKHEVTPFPPSTPSPPPFRSLDRNGPCSQVPRRVVTALRHGPSGSSTASWTEIFSTLVCHRSGRSDRTWIAAQVAYCGIVATAQSFWARDRAH